MDILNRTMIGIRLPDELRTKMAEVQKTLRWRAGSEAVRWTPPGEMLILLTALGEIGVGSLARVKVVLEPVFQGYAPLNLTVAGVGGSPTVLQPRFIWAGLGGDLDRLKELHDKVEWVVKPHCPDHEVRPFEPHIALGRLKQQNEADRTALGRAVKIAAVGEIGAFTATQVELLRSVGTTAGPTLVTEAVYQLAG